MVIAIINMKAHILFALLVRSVLGTVNFLAPIGKPTFTVQNGAVTVDLEWVDTDYPPIERLTKSRLLLCSGPNSDLKCENFQELTREQYISGRRTIRIPSGAGQNGDYLVQMYLEWGGDNAVQYSPRFTLEGMTGTQPAGKVEDAEGPRQEAHIRAPDYSTFSRFLLPYGRQTGRARFAPMQTQPGAKVTATTWTRRYATSSVSYFATLAATPSQLTTVTPGWNYEITSVRNDAPPALQPIANAGWYQPSSRKLTAHKVDIHT